MKQVLLGNTDAFYKFGFSEKDYKEYLSCNGYTENDMSFEDYKDDLQKIDYRNIVESYIDEPIKPYAVFIMDNPPTIFNKTLIEIIDVIKNEFNNKDYTIYNVNGYILGIALDNANEDGLVHSLIVKPLKADKVDEFKTEVYNNEEYNFASFDKEEFYDKIAFCDTFPIID